MRGHITNFNEYQQDAAALVDAIKALALTEPWSLLAHSMGGCIGFRALRQGLPVNSVVFTGPMWGIKLSSPQRVAAWILSRLACCLQRAEHYVPGTSGAPYLLKVAFENNKLTNDRDSFDDIKSQLERHPVLGLGGLSFSWLNASLKEMHHLSTQPSPDVPCVTYLGEHERIVDPQSIRIRMAGWPRGRLITLPDTRHEVLMEGTALRRARTDEITSFFAQNH